MFSQLNPYLCALVSLYLMCSFAYDICDYHKLQTAKRTHLERQEEIREETRSRLRNLIELAEKEDIDSDDTRRWLELNSRLKISDFRFSIETDFPD